MDALILTRDEGAALSCFEGKRVVPLDHESANYREWLVTIGDTHYCIVCEVCDGETWTVMSYDPRTDLWGDAPDDVDTFLTQHRLILAA